MRRTFTMPCTVSLVVAASVVAACSTDTKGGASDAGGAVDARTSNGGATGSGGTSTGSGGTSTGSGGTSTGSGGTSTGSGGAPTSGGTSTGSGGASSSGGTRAQGGASGATDCSAPGLVWKSANKTNYTSYPDPNSEECIKYNGCMYEGQFAACDGVKPESWVMAHDIVAVFPDFGTLKLHDLCLRSGTKTRVVTVIDECADSDCSGCCTQNRGRADELIDIEKYTNDRFGVDDGPIEWADLGPTKTMGCK